MLDQRQYVSSALKEKLKTLILSLALLSIQGQCFAEDTNMAIEKGSVRIKLSDDLTLDTGSTLGLAARLLFGRFVPTSGVFGLTWSPDGQKLAAFTSYGETIKVWNRDGSVDREIHRACAGIEVCSVSLQFIHGHSQLIMSASALGSWSSIDAETKLVVNDSVVSIYDMDKRDVVAQVKGPSPGHGFVANAASTFVASPDGSQLAVTYHAPNQTHIGIYSTQTGKQTAFFRVGGSIDHIIGPVAFSSDGSTLAVAAYDVVYFYSTNDWAQKTFFRPFDPGNVVAGGSEHVAANHLAFDAEGMYIAVGAAGGGSYWIDERGRAVAQGQGKHKEQYPTDPVRIFTWPDLKQTYSLSGFSGRFGLLIRGMDWLPGGKTLAYLSLDGRLLIWRHARGQISVAFEEVDKSAIALAVDPTGNSVAVSYARGAKIFSIINQPDGGTK